jgi:methionyl-tRNA synthetase
MGRFTLVTSQGLTSLQIVTHGLSGRNVVLYICGSDEYGVAITLSAEQAGRTPKEHVRSFIRSTAIFQADGFSFDHFSRTTWHGHNATVQQFFLDLKENSHIEERVTNQLYSKRIKNFSPIVTWLNLPQVRLLRGAQ